MKVPLEEWPEFEVTDFQKRLYTCQVNIWSIDIRFEKRVEVIVLGMSSNCIHIVFTVTVLLSFFLN